MRCRLGPPPLEERYPWTLHTTLNSVSPGSDSSTRTTERQLPGDRQQAPPNFWFPSPLCFPSSFLIPGNGARRQVNEDPASLPFTASHVSRYCLVQTQRSKWNTNGLPPPHSHDCVLSHQPLTGRHQQLPHLPLQFYPLRTTKGDPLKWVIIPH